MDGKTLKPSQEIEPGNLIQVLKEGFYMQFEVVKPIGKRVSAILARPCYINRTPEDELRKYDSWFVGKSGVEKRERGAGRPTKRARREIDEFKDFDSNLYDVEMNWDEI
jgi:ribosome-associated heat shock protein Hsp15